MTLQREQIILVTRNQPISVAGFAQPQQEIISWIGRAPNVGKCGWHLGDRHNLIHESANFGRTDQGTNFFAPGYVADFIDLQHVADQNETTIEPRVDKPRRHPIGGDHPAQQDIRIKDNAHLLLP